MSDLRTEIRGAGCTSPSTQTPKEKGACIFVEIDGTRYHFISKEMTERYPSLESGNKALKLASRFAIDLQQKRQIPESDLEAYHALVSELESEYQNIRVTVQLVWNTNQKMKAILKLLKSILKQMEEIQDRRINEA